LKVKNFFTALLFWIDNNNMILSLTLLRGSLRLVFASVFQGAKTGMDYWTDIFWFLISFFTFFGTGWYYFIENQCLTLTFSPLKKVFCFKLECEY